MLKEIIKEKIKISQYHLFFMKEELERVKNNFKVDKVIIIVNENTLEYKYFYTYHYRYYYNYIYTIEYPAFCRCGDQISKVWQTDIYKLYDRNFLRGFFEFYSNNNWWLIN